jgi:hypothetical protein
MAQTVHGRWGECEGNDDCFFSIRGVIVIEWVSEGQMINQKYYLEILTKLREQVRKKISDLWKKKSWIMHQDNTPAHTALTMKQFLAGKCIPVLQHPPIYQI